jgi:hypothetical protein
MTIDLGIFIYSGYVYIMDPSELPNADTPEEPLSSQQVYMKAYYIKNRERILEKARNISPEGRRQISIVKKKWYQENKEVVKAKQYKFYGEKRRGFK